MSGGLRVVGRTYRHVNRYREVAVILAKHGFGDVLHALKLDHFVDAGLRGLRGEPKVLAELSRPERVRMAVQELGPTFIKAGQYLSTRPDLLSPEYLRELAKLQDAVEPFAFEEVRRIVEEDLGAPLERLFPRFSREPLAAASIAQVHAARLPDGAAVAVKVERPGLREIVRTDLEIMAHLASIADRRTDAFGGHEPGKIVAEISRSLDREIDLSLEASHSDRFRRQFALVPSVRVPFVVRELCSPRVLTMELMSGIKADDPSALRRAGIDPGATARTIVGHYLSMIFVHGFFHADPHPGNLLVSPGPVIGYLDFGMMGRVDRPTRESLADIVRAVSERDEAALCRALLSLAEAEKQPDSKAFQTDVAELMDQYAYRPLRDWRLGRMLEQLFQVTKRHGVRVPPELFLMLKTLTELETLANALAPDFDAVSAAAPFVRWTLEERARPARLIEEASAAGLQALRLLAETPFDVQAVLRRMRSGKLPVEFEHKGLEPLVATIDKVIGRLAVAVVLAALIIGSALLIHAGRL